MARGIDFAFSPHPSLDAIRKYGATFVCRYVSPQPDNDRNGKNLLPAEAKALRDAGIAIVVVSEQWAERMLTGRPAGAADATHADAVVKALHMPGLPVYFACDWDATPAQQPAINAYLDGAASVIGRDRTGIYAGYWPLHRALDAAKCRYGWQTYAWSAEPALNRDAYGHTTVLRLDGRDYWFDTRAQLRQIRNGITVGGADCDLDEAVADDYGQWPRPAPATAPAADWAYGPPQNLTVRAGDASVLVERCDPPAGAPVPPDHYEISVFTGSYPSPETLVGTYPRYMKAAPHQFGSLQDIPSGMHMTLRAVAYGPAGTHAGAYADVHFMMP